jgi:aspartate-semialdehyde dehydrogenase
MPLTATGQYDVEVGRLRKSLVFGDHGLEFFVSGDQLLRGAALNAVLVAEEMAKNGALEEAKSILIFFSVRVETLDHGID